MSERLTGIVLAHEELARALVGAVRAIAGEEHGLVPVSNSGCDRAALAARLSEAVAGRRALIFTDLRGGSCSFGASAYAHGHESVRVVTGVNLAMLLDFALNRDRGLEEAASHALQAGRDAVTAGAR